MWNYLVDEHTKYLNASEKEIQEKWEKEYLLDAELFGYSKAMGDVDSQRSLHIGSSDRAIPDIILRKDGKDLFVIELKQYSLHKNSDFEKQLLTYLTHTDIHLSIGVLVCNKLYVCFHNHSSNQTEWLEIPFEEDNELGAKFVELLSKKQFDSEKVQEFITENARQANDILEIQRQLEEPDFILELVKKHFAEKYDAQIIEKSIAEYTFECRRKAKPVQASFSPSHEFQNVMPKTGGTPEIEFKINGTVVEAGKFKEKLLQTKRAERTWFFADGEIKTDEWYAPNFSEESGLLGNIRSNNSYRNLKKRGLCKVVCEING